MSAFTQDELRGIISALKEAHLRAAASGGVTSYTLNTGQGSTTVHQASLTEITNQIKIYSEMLAELVAVETGSNLMYVTDLGL